MINSAFACRSNIQVANAKTLWGKIITYLRENKNVALQMSCGDIMDVSIENEKLIAFTTEEYIYNMVSTEYALNEIKKAIAFFGYNYKFEISLKEKPKDKTKEDLDKLSAIVKDYLKIIN